MTIDRITPDNTAAWHQLRGRDITASVIGALFGCHPYATPYSLWAQKTGRLPPDNIDSPQLRRGRYMEVAAVQMLRDENPTWKITHNAAENVYYRDPALRLGATPDVIAYKPGRGYGVVQIKSVDANAYRRGWLDEDDTPDAPLWIALQAMLEAHLTGAKWAAVAPIVMIGSGLEMPLLDISLEHMPAIIQQMADKSAEFWQMIEADIEPRADYERDGQIIDAVYREGDDEDWIDLRGHNRVEHLLAQIADASKQAAAAKRQADACKAELKSLMAHATVALIEGGRKITWREHREPGGYRAPSSSRVLRLPKTT